MEQYFLQEIFRNKIEQIRTVNAGISMRTIAKMAGIHPAALSEFLSGKRRISRKMAKKLCENLSFTPFETKQVGLFFDEENQTPKTTQQKDAEYKQLKLTNEMFQVLADPLYYSFLSLINTHDFQNEEQWIADRLRTTVKQVQEVKKKLLALKFIEEEGEVLRTLSENLGTEDNIPNSSLKARHRVNCEDAAIAITNCPIEDRYFAFETLNINKKDLKEVQRKYNDLLDELILLSKKAQDTDEVYEFCVNYFPRSYRKDH